MLQEYRSVYSAAAGRVRLPEHGQHADSAQLLDSSSSGIKANCGVSIVRVKFSSHFGVASSSRLRDAHRLFDIVYSIDLSVFQDDGRRREGVLRVVKARTLPVRAVLAGQEASHLRDGRRRIHCLSLSQETEVRRHHIIGCDWKRNEHMPVRQPCSSHVLFKIARKVEQHVSEASTLRTRSSHRLQRFARACSMLCKGADSACS